MSYVTTTRWEDDDIVAVSDDGLVRVVLRPDQDTELDGDYLPILVRKDGRGYTSAVTSCAGERWYHPNAAAANGDDDAFARAVDHFTYEQGWKRSGVPVHREDMLVRWVRIFLGGSGVIRISTQDAEYFACDSAALRELWGLLPSTVYGEGDVSDYDTLKGFFDGETYGYAVQTREDPEDDDSWEDTDDTCYGLIGRDWAEAEATEALASYQKGN